MNLANYSYFSGMCNMTAETQHSPAEASPVVLSPTVSLDSSLQASPPLMLQARSKDNVLIKSEPRGGSSPNTEDGAALGQTEEHLPTGQPPQEKADPAAEDMFDNGSFLRRRKRFKRTDVSTYPGYMQSSSAFTPTPMGRPTYPNTLYAGIGSGYGSQLSATSPHPAMLHHYQASGQGQPRMFSIDNIISQQSGGDLNSQGLQGMGLGGGDMGTMTSSCLVTGTDPSSCFQNQAGNPSGNMLSRNSGNLSSNLSAGYPYSSSASPPNLPTMTQSGFSPGSSQVYCSGNRLSLPALRPGSCAEHTDQLLGLSNPMNSYNNSYMRQANFASGLERYM
ncbi:hypothetical protein CesoFtcFv8_005400 [Champsocephalus esox]|uniref:Uncharacterized protein n=1 Tax=Champsocephalus esox TaxID=159716 RepID=A0AAN8H9N7_9TELE|nr:hypothetical protein CesoFtcFv8_005400 [Champsocephalus esox]